MPDMHGRHPRLTLMLAAGEEITQDGLQWIEVMPTREKARNGRWYFTVTREDLETYAQSIRDSTGDPIPVDYDHEGDEGGSTRAAGWFTGQAEVRDIDGGARLFAQVRWTPRAAREIQDGEYRRISPVFSFHDRDEKTGLMTRAKAIIAATLTNRPFFRELAPVASSVVWAPDEGWQQLQQRLYAALNPGGLGEGRFWVMDVAAGKALVQEYSTNTTWVAEFTVQGDGTVEVAARDEWTEAVQEWVEAARSAIATNTARRPFKQTTSKETEMDPKVIAAALGLPEDADEQTIVAAAAEARAKAEKAVAPENTDRVAALEQELADEKTKRVESERQAMLARAVDEGRVTPAQAETFSKTFGENLDGLRDVLATFEAGTTTPAAAGVGGDTPPAPDQAKAREQAVAGLRAKTDEVDTGSLDLHVTAEALLRQDGKTEYTAEEYVQAVERAKRGETVKAAA